jgi:GNAT superfamily N-acetyltransferase
VKQRPGLSTCFWGPGLSELKQPDGIEWLPGDDSSVLCATYGLPYSGPQPPDFQGIDDCLAPEAMAGKVKGYDVDLAPSLNEFKKDHASGVLVARWLVVKEMQIQALAAALRASSKAGLWNQVELPAGANDKLAAWCAANPNLAHSVSIVPSKSYGFCGPPLAKLEPESDVGILQPMPGRPFWRWLGQGAHLALYVHRHGVRQVRTCRIRDDGTTYNLGMGVEYHFVHYPDLNEWHLQNILDLINSAGKVKPDWLRHNIEHSFLVAYALEEGMMIATETLKHPRPEYIKKVRERTGLDFTKHLERGYIVVRPEYRGLGVGDKLVIGCLARAPGYKTFLAIGAENKLGQELTARHGSRFLTSYYSEEVGKEIQIWTPRDQDDLLDGDEAKCK